MPALPALTAFSFGTTQLILTYADGRVFYVNYKNIICNLDDPTTGEVILRIYQDGQITLVISANDLVAIGTTISAFLASLNTYVANSGATSSLGAKMRRITNSTGAVTVEAFTALLMNSGTTFTVLVDSAGDNMLSAPSIANPGGQNLSGLSISTGIVIRANDGRTIRDVTVSSSSSIFAYYN